MRICLVTHCFPHNDQDVNGNWIPQFVRLLIQRGHRVSVLTPRMDLGDGSIPKADWPFGVRYFKWLGGKRRLGQLKFINPIDAMALVSLLCRGRIELEKLIGEHEIDLCLGVWAIPNGYFCLKAKQRLGTPYAVWTLGSDINVYGGKIFFGKVVADVLRNADHLFANSNQLVNRIGGLTGKACGFMPTTRTLPEGLGPRLSLDETAANCLFVGRLERVKGIDLLVEAMVGLLRKGRRAFLYVLGDGSLRSDLMNRVRREGLEHNVVFTGWADPDAVAAYLKACDVLVVPSRSEGMPVVYWEAMQAGRPVIVTDVGDMADYTRRFQVGKVVPTEDTAGLRQALEEYMDGLVSIDREGIRKLARESSLESAVETFLTVVIGNVRS
ncbi:MAG: glycosyltransferase [bacterium]